MGAYEKLVDALERSGCRPHGGNARCPAHEDRVASLSYGRGDKGAVVKCHAGTNCTTKRICESIGLTMRDLFDDMPERNVGSSAPKPTNAPLGDPTTAYVYYDEGGTPLYRVLRYNPKTFRQQKYTNGTWEWGMEGVKRVIYHLQDVLLAIEHQTTIWVVEGEKDVETLNALGLNATCNLGGAGPGKWKDEYSVTFKGANVALIADNDDVGRAHADEVGRSLEAAGAKVTVVGLGDAKDVSDWAIGRVDPKGELEALLDAARATPAPTIAPDWVRFMETELPPIEPVVDPIISVGDIVQVHAWRGLGKSMFLMQMAFSISAGRDFLKWSVPKPFDVMLVDGEMLPQELKRRMAVISCTGEPGHEIQPDPPTRLRIMSAMALPNGIPSLATEEGQRWFEPYLDMSQVFIFDHLSALFRGAGEENDASSWDSTQEWLLRLRAMGKTLCFAHHDNKSREQRGTSKREDVLSVSIHLKELEDDEADGTHFKVKFDKSRSVSGDPIAPFEARLVPQDGIGFRRHWVISGADDEVDLEIEEMLKLGKSVRQIAIKLKISHGSAQRKVTRIRNRMMNVGPEVGGEK